MSLTLVNVWYIFMKNLTYMLVSTRLLFIISMILITSFTSYSQESKIAEHHDAIHIKQRVDVDFTFQDPSAVTPELIAKLDISLLERFRKQSTRYLLTDPATGLVIIIFSKEEATQRKIQHEQKKVYRSNLK